MWFIRTAKMRTDPLSQLLCRKQAVGFHNRTLAMYPLRLDGIEPGTFRGEPKGQDTHACARLFHLLIVVSDPGSHDLTDMPGRVVPDQQPGALALRRQLLAAPVEKLGGDIAHGTPGDKAQPH